jgi:histidinol dehydrogenase
MLRIIHSDQVGKLLKRRAARFTEAEQVVRPILEDVRKHGDTAVMSYARRFDQLDERSFVVKPAELAAAASRLSANFLQALHTASDNIRAFAQFQLPQDKMRRFPGGRTMGQIVRPLDTVAAYIPSGRYPLPSTLMMTVIPAQVAGVPNICVTSPRPVDAIYGAAHELGVNRVFRIGGAHAIAAFAYGTKTVPRADRIVGPGNIFVAAAKKLLAGEVGIDFVAGPTEIVIIAAEGDPRHIAFDMLAQAEHDLDASAILLTTSKRLGNAVAKQVHAELKTLSTASIAAKAIEKNSAVVLVRTLEEAVEIANRFAPEHLAIPDASLLPAVRHAGSVFMGTHSPEAAGDYASGPNHVLPTSGAARIRGGLSVSDYLKVITVQELTPQGLAKLAPAITTLARAEGLEAHARSVEVRLDND